MKRRDDILEAFDRNEVLDKNGKTAADNEHYYWLGILAFILLMSLMGYFLKLYIYEHAPAVVQSPANETEPSD